jgi:hypothetical protein
MTQVYGIQCGTFIKVGFARDVKVRLEIMRLYNPNPCKLVFNKYSPEPMVIERELHALLKEHAIGREWFKINPDQLKAAYKVVEAAYALRRRAQVEWERETAARVAAKSGREVENAKLRG